MTYERLVVGETVAFEHEQDRGWIQRDGLAIVGADGLNWDFADEELSILGYLANVLPKDRGPTIFGLCRYAFGMRMVSTPLHVSQASTVSAQMRRLARSPELVRDFEEFLRGHGINERLEVRVAPDGEPVLYDRHQRRIPFTQACSSGMLTLLQLFSLFRMDATTVSSLVYLDDIDAHLSLGATGDLNGWLGHRATSQTISTTHNASLVRNDGLRPDCVFEIVREPRTDDGPSDLSIRPWRE